MTSSPCSSLREREKTALSPTRARLVHHKTHLTPENINDPEIALGEDNLELSRIESGTRFLTDYEIFALTKIFNVSADYIIGRK